MVLLFGVVCRYCCLVLCVGTDVWCCVSVLLFGVVCRYCCLVLCVGTVVWCCVSVLLFGVVCRSLHVTFVLVCGGLETFQFGAIFSVATLTVILYARISNLFRLQYLTSIFTAWLRFFGAAPSIRLS